MHRSTAHFVSRLVFYSAGLENDAWFGSHPSDDSIRGYALHARVTPLAGQRGTFVGAAPSDDIDLQAREPGACELVTD